MRYREHVVCVLHLCEAVHDLVQYKFFSRALNTYIDTREYTYWMIAKGFCIFAPSLYVLRYLFTLLFDFKILDWPAFHKLIKTSGNWWNPYTRYFVSSLLLIVIFIMLYCDVKIVLLIFQTSKKCADLRRTEYRHLVYDLRRKLFGYILLGTFFVLFGIVDIFVFGKNLRLPGLTQ